MRGTSQRRFMFEACGAFTLKKSVEVYMNCSIFLIIYKSVS
jgi:hypothetical protein